MQAIILSPCLLPAFPVFIQEEGSAVKPFCILFAQEPKTVKCFQLTSRVPLQGMKVKVKYHASGGSPYLPISFIILLCFLTLAISPGARMANSAESSSWRNLEKGLDIGIFQAPKKSVFGDSLIRILRADTASFDLRLLNASSKDQGKRWSVKDWANRNGLVAAVGNRRNSRERCFWTRF